MLMLDPSPVAGVTTSVPQYTFNRKYKLLAPDLAKLNKLRLSEVVTRILVIADNAQTSADLTRGLVQIFHIAAGIRIFMDRSAIGFEVNNVDLVKSDEGHE